MTEAPSTISDQLGRKRPRSTTIRCSVTRPYKSWTIWSRRNLILPGRSLEQGDHNKMIKPGTEVNNHLVHILSQSSMLIPKHQWMDVDLPLPVPASSAGANHVSTSSQPLQREHSTSQDKEDPNEGSESDAQLNNNFCLFASDQVTLNNSSTPP